MKRYIALSLLLLALWQVVAVARDDSADVVAARKARDHGDADALRMAIAKAQKEADQAKNFDAYLRLALLHEYLIEALQAKQDDKLIKMTAQAGIPIAEKAIKLNPKSSEAHQLLGSMLGELIPYVFGGGMRYGARSSSEIDEAIKLDPKNSDAYVTKAISYLFTPSLFGGSKDKAFETLKKAVDADPTSDTPHIWLAQAYLESGRKDDATREIKEALRLNPERGFAKYVQDQINKSK
ncbi:MAG TPA: tetratricopeptide repeat protein [Blastocatellia bacterium]|nr:tetratricopeptide repeat protein [Blastocatellia bacterium]